jgi:hypothetical protein
MGPDDSIDARNIGCWSVEERHTDLMFADLIGAAIGLYATNIHKKVDESLGILKRGCGNDPLDERELLLPPGSRRPGVHDYFRNSGSDHDLIKTDGCCFDVNGKTDSRVTIHTFATLHCDTSV